MVKGFLMLKSADTPYKDWDRRYRRGKKRVVTYVEPQTKAAMDIEAGDLGLSVAEWLRRVIALQLTRTEK